MNMKRFVLAGCATLILGVSTAMAGPCDTSGRAANLKDAGSGPAWHGRAWRETHLEAADLETIIQQPNAHRDERC